VEPGAAPSSPACGPQTLEYLSRAFDDESRTITTPSAMFALVATMVGGGVLSLPYAMSQCGIALGSICLFVSAIASTWTIDMLVECARCTGRDTFELIGHAAFGEYSRKATVFLVFVLTWLALVAYSVLISDLLTPVVELVVPGVVNDLSLTSLHQLTLCVVTLIVSPMCFAGSMASLRFLCFASVGSVVLVGAVIAFRAFQTIGEAHLVDIMMPNKETSSAIFMPEYRMWPEDWGQVLYVFPMFGVSYMCHFNALPLHSGLTRPTRWRMRRMLIFTMSFTTVLYLFIGIAGYLFASVCTCGNILLNFPNKDPLVVFARVALGLVLMLNFPLLCQPCRSAFYRLILGFCSSASSPQARSLSSQGISVQDHVALTASFTLEDGTPTGQIVTPTDSVPLSRASTEAPASSRTPPTRSPSVPTGPPSSPNEARVHVYFRNDMDAARNTRLPCEALDSFLPKDETVQQGASEPTCTQRYVLTTVILVGCLLLSCFLQSVLVVWSILGSTVCFLIGFILPAAFWRKIIGPMTGELNRKAAELLVLVTVVLAFCCTVQAATKLDVAPCPPLPSLTEAM